MALQFVSRTLDLGQVPLLPRPLGHHRRHTRSSALRRTKTSQSALRPPPPPAHASQNSIDGRETLTSTASHSASLGAYLPLVKWAGNSHSSRTTPAPLDDDDDPPDAPFPWLGADLTPDPPDRLGDDAVLPPDDLSPDEP